MVSVSTFSIEFFVMRPVRRVAFVGRSQLAAALFDERGSNSRRRSWRCRIKIVWSVHLHAMLGSVDFGDCRGAFRAAWRATAGAPFDLVPNPGGR